MHDSTISKTASYNSFLHDALPGDGRLGHARSSGCRRQDCSKTPICTGNCSSYNEARSLCFLLCHLLSFNGTCVLSAESKIGDGNIVQIYVEVLRSLRQNPPNVSTDHLRSQSNNGSEHWIPRQQYNVPFGYVVSDLSHSQQLTGIILRNYTLECFLQHMANVEHTVTLLSYGHVLTAASQTCPEQVDQYLDD